MAFDLNNVDGEKVILALTEDVTRVTREKAFAIAQANMLIEELNKANELNAQLQHRLEEIAGEVEAIKAAQKSSPSSKTPPESEVIEGELAG